MTVLVCLFWTNPPENKNNNCTFSFRCFSNKNQAGSDSLHYSLDPNNHIKGKKKRQSASEKKIHLKGYVPCLLKAIFFL